MSRRSILGLIFVALILGIAGWIFFSTNGPAQNPSANQTTSGNTGLSSLFPFGKSTPPPTTQSSNTSTQGTQNTTTSSTATTSSTPPALNQISARLIAGFYVVPPITAVGNKKTPTPSPAFNAATNSFSTQSTLPQIDLVESGTGYVYSIDAAGQNEKKLSQTTIAQALNAFFINGGNSVVIQYIKTDDRTVATFLGQLIPPAVGDVAGTLKGTFLPDNLFDISPSPDGKSLLYLMPMDGGTAGISMKADGTGKKQLFTSSFTEWLLDWKKNALTVTTKAAADNAGYAYKITNSGAFQKILGDINGLTTNISPDGNSILYSVGENGGLSLHVFHLKDLSDTTIGLSTLPEKCVWSQDSVTAYCGASTTVLSGPYPDSWYQGTFHFNDALWKVDTKAGTTTQLSNGGGNYLDVTKPALDSSEKYLFFVNKNDQTLWAFNISK